ncbi:endoplasmic reticulum-Golgi intermediate compartment protein 1-like isoform X2 [Oppia nitens]|uniref:endoplasmic reticulum-Golgi intermediate compartment protein 1-like isoform X2 n=1 Tax=Oppia nitens TaxID=1686743 RepID=UPI0023DA055B|nr:endoplasmic reticulum-Golgi intermediate compartment protein 1-like isoform X2 [Oppia nitens]
MAFDVRRLDVYRKIPQDLTQPTVTGAFISICCLLIISYLFIAELVAFISTEVSSELFVDNIGENNKISVRLNISLPRLSCSVIGLDIQDDNGRHEVGFIENTEKFEIESGIGCRFESRFQINRVAGNFHVSTHSAHKQPESIDMTHLIHEISFGDEMQYFDINANFNPLKSMDKTKAEAIESHEYHIKIVPTIYDDLSGNYANGFQYTYAYKSHIAFTHHGIGMPAIWFRYDLTPITVKYTRKRKPLYSFLTMICAIIGGTFSVAGIIDSIIFTASNVFRKFELGKLS